MEVTEAIRIHLTTLTDKEEKNPRPQNKASKIGFIHLLFCFYNLIKKFNFQLEQKFIAKKEL